MNNGKFIDTVKNGTYIEELFHYLHRAGFVAFEKRDACSVWSKGGEFISSSLAPVKPYSTVFLPRYSRMSRPGGHIYVRKAPAWISPKPQRLSDSRAIPGTSVPSSHSDLSGRSTSPSCGNIVLSGATIMPQGGKFSASARKYQERQKKEEAR